MRRATHGHSLVSAALVLFAALPAAAEWVDWIADAELAFEYTDNINNSAFSAWRKHDFSWHPGARAGRVYQLGESARLDLSAEILGEIYQRFHKLDSVAGFGHASLSYKFGLGNAPWGRVFFAGGYKGVRDAKRSGSRLEAGVEFGKRFWPRFDASLAYRFTNRDGREGPVAVPGLPTDVFDQQYHLLTLTGNFLVTERLLLSAAYSFRDGDFDSSYTGNVGLTLMDADVKAAAVDEVFNGSVYRLLGTGQGASVHLNYGLTNRLSLDLGYRYQYGESRKLTYRSNSARVTVLFRY